MKIFTFLFAILSMAVYAQIPQTGLVAYYNFDNNLNSHDGAHNFTNPNNSSFVSAGKVGSGIAFANNGSIINTTLATAMNNAEFTFCFWFKENAYNASSPMYSSMLEAFGSAYVRRRPNISAANPPTEMGYAASPSAWYGYQVSSGNFSVGDWHHAAIMLSPGTSAPYRRTIQLYIDGVLFSQAQAANSTSFLHQFHNKFTMGGGTDGSGNIDVTKNFSGVIDELYIYDRVLTSTEINTVKNNTGGYLAMQSFGSKDGLIKIYPNPVKDILNIKINGDIQKAELYNHEGKKIKETNQKSINVSSLPQGIYLLKVTDVNNHTGTQKILKTD